MSKSGDKAMAKEAEQLRELIDLYLKENLHVTLIWTKIPVKNKDLHLLHEAKHYMFLMLMKKVQLMVMIM